MNLTVNAVKEGKTACITATTFLMTNYLECPQLRKRGTASRDNYNPRYKQPEFEWTPVDNDSSDGVAAEVPYAASVHPPVPRNEQVQQQQSTVSLDVNLVRKRRRKKRKKISPYDSNENEFMIGEASTIFKEGAMNRPLDDAKRAKLQRMSNEATRQATTTKTKDAPPTPEAARTKLVSPEDEAQKVTAPTNPQKTKSPHGKRVLEVEYSLIRSNIFTCEHDRDDDDGLPNSKENEEWVDRITSNAADSPRPHAAVEAIHNGPDDELPPMPLSDVVQDGNVVTKQSFFSRSSYSPVLVMSDLPLSTNVFKGQFGSSPLHWWQATGGTLKHLFLAFANDGCECNSEGRRQLEWEANVLDWILTCNDGRQLESFPKPLWLQATSANDSRVLCLSLTSERESFIQHQILGTLEDLVHLHARYNNGPIPEPLIAHLVLEIFQCVCTLHQSGVTHDNLGLDSFLLVRRKQAPSDGEIGVNAWFLMCTGLGSEAKVGRQLGVSFEAQNSGDDARWRFKHDLYSVANISHLLLSGGIPLSWKRNATGLIDLQSKNVYANIYLRGKLAWRELFHSLLNPPNPSCGMHLAENARWTDTMTHARNMVKDVSKMDETRQCYLDRLMDHVMHERASGPVSICAVDRFPVKLIGNPLEDESDSSRSTTAQQENHAHPVTPRELELLISLEERDHEISSLYVAKEIELQEARNECKEQRRAKEAFQRLVEDTRVKLEETARKYREIEHYSAMQSRGFITAMNEKDRALAKLRRDLQQSTATRGTVSSSADQMLQDAEKTHRSEMSAAGERIVGLEAEKCDLVARLKAVEERLKNIETEKKQLEELQEVVRMRNSDQEKQLHAAQETVHRLEATLEQMNEERRQDKEQALIDIQKLKKRSPNGRTLEASHHATATIAILQRKHDNEIRQLKELHRVESKSRRKLVAELQAQLSKQAEKHKQAESSIEALQGELSRSKLSMEAQSKLQDEAELRLKKEIDRLEGQARNNSKGYGRQLLMQQGEAKSVLEAQQNLYERELSKKEAASQEREAVLMKRIQELEEAERCRAEGVECVQQARKTAATASRLRAGGSPQTSVSSQASRGTMRYTSSRLLQATEPTIPGMSLTGAGALPQNAPPTGTQPSDSSRTSNGPTLVITDPWESESDSDCSL